MADGDLDLSDVRPNDPRWNSWTILQPVQFEGEERAMPRKVRLWSAAARVGDPVQITTETTIVYGRIVAVRHSVLHVRPSSS
jgi:hypothetical protein